MAMTAAFITHLREYFSVLLETYSSAVLKVCFHYHVCYELARSERTKLTVDKIILIRMRQLTCNDGPREIL